ncbi:MAG TPA: zinc ribbon domain-containing protein [Gammaproteobacteria bacterium]|nr:zinc ribbon domain-containing protein [Gammaproteobacteria bacterium]
MPIYEYECDKCGRQFETLVRADAQAQCPGCGSHALHKQMSAFAVGGGTTAQQSVEETCARCGNAPGSCAIN